VLVKMQDEWRDKGLIVVGVHVKPSVKDQALDLCRAHKMNFPNYCTGWLEYKGVDGTPTAYIFDSAGNMVHNGAFAGREKLVENLLNAAPDWITGPQAFEKVAAEAEQIRQRKDLGTAAAALRAKSWSEDSTEKEEARELLARLEKYAEGLFKRAESRIAAGYPDAALEMLKKVASDFKGDTIGNRAADAVKAKEADEAFKAEIKALRAYEALAKTAENLKPRRQEQTEEKWRAKNQAVIAQLEGLYRLMEKKFSGTCVLKRAEEDLKNLRLR
jgi:hypothetical protein